MSKDYGEPLFVMSGAIHSSNRIDGDTIICHAPKETLHRAVACTNALQGIPTESLGEVKKAWLSWKIFDTHGYCYTPTFCHETEIGIDVNCRGNEVQELTYVEVDLIIKAAKNLRSRGADFGELNALIDSVKE